VEEAARAMDEDGDEGECVRRLDDGRLVVHVDLDAFYAQVEGVRRGLSSDVPLAVQQWNAVIAVNYAARAYGVSRHLKIEQVLEKCPNIKLVHVDTIPLPSNHIVHAQHPHPERQQHTHPHAMPHAQQQQHTQQEKSKVSLAVYREASEKIMDLLSEPRCTLEKASIDEAFIDVTQRVDELLACRAVSDTQLDTALRGSVLAAPSCSAAHGSTLQENAVALDFAQDSRDRRLVTAAWLALQLRNRVRHALGYTCSAGVSINKMLAKLASAMNKPNQQTILSEHVAEALVAELPIERLRFLGGKLGGALREKGMRTAGDVRSMPRDALAALLKLPCDDRNVSFVYDAVRGEDHTAVRDRQLTKSMLAAKRFSVETKWAGVSRWAAVLAEELVERLKSHAERHPERAPRTLTISFKCTALPSTLTRSAPLMPIHAIRADAVLALAMRTLQSVHDRNSSSRVLPCSFLGLTATNFAAQQKDALTQAAASASVMKRFLATNASQPPKKKPSGAVLNYSADTVGREWGTVPTKPVDASAADVTKDQNETDDERRRGERQISQEEADRKLALRLQEDEERWAKVTSRREQIRARKQARAVDPRRFGGQPTQNHDPNGGRTQYGASKQKRPPPQPQQSPKRQQSIAVLFHPHVAQPAARTRLPK